MTTTLIKSKPIIFTGESVRAILDGRKTMTRRVINPQPKNPPFSARVEDGRIWWELNERCNWIRDDDVRAKYRSGDRLWVKEGYGEKDGYIPSHESRCLYRADAVRDDSGERDGWWVNEKFVEGEIRWRSPLFMPRRASRLTLEITEVKVERTHDISEADAVAEGCESKRLNENPDVWATAKEQFAYRWYCINGRKHPCSSTCWVWAISFRRIQS